MQFKSILVASATLLIGSAAAFPTDNNVITKRAAGDVIKPVNGINCGGKKFSAAGVERAVKEGLKNELAGTKVNRKGTFNPGYPKRFISIDQNGKDIDWTPKDCQNLSKFNLKEFPIIGNADLFVEGEREGQYRVIFHVTDDDEATFCGAVYHPQPTDRGFLKCKDA